jgi:hypothetical protein
MNLRGLELKGKFLLMQISPFKSGNAMKAIRSTSTKSSILYSYDLNQADYIKHLEEGTRKSGKHVGYISQDSVYALTRLISDIYNNNRGSETLNIQTLAQRTKTTPAGQLQFLRSIAR